MLSDKASSAIVAVSDLARARQFYETTLGLVVADDTMGEVVVFRTGATHLVVYRSDEAGTNRANAVVWDVGRDFETIVEDLRGKGVIFEHYPGADGFERDGDIHRSGSMMMVWFKDPDANILHLNAM